jgi:parvulin-like peptidyl-prolyl isomerase
MMLLAGCDKPGSLTPSAVVETPLAPTETSVPMALMVNGQGITLVEYNAALLRLKEAQESIGQPGVEQEQVERVLRNFTDELLLAQAAVQNGRVVDDAELQTRIDKLVADVGGEANLVSWQERNYYTPETFRESLRRAILVTWQRDEIINAVPMTAEHIRARQILVQDEDNAVYAYAQLQSGADFETLAFLYDFTLGGDLGWFPRGMLTQPNVEDAVFALQPGEYTEVIKSAIGYHIVYVIEREMEHALSIESRRMMQEKALQAWLEAARAASSIEILVQ